MAWIELHQSVLDHEKTMYCADTLGLKPVHMVGHLAALWLWAVDNTSDGTLSKRVTAKTIARVAHWDGDPDEFVQTLIDAGFMERNEEGCLVIHDWMHYARRLLEVKQQKNELRQAYKNGVISKVRQRDKDRCRYCGRVVDWTDRKTAKGGTYDLVDPSGPSTVENLVVACRGCSWKKAGRTPEEAGMRLLSGHVPASNRTLKTSSNASPKSSLNRSSNDPTDDSFDDPLDEFDEPSNESSEWHLPTYLTNQLRDNDYKIDSGYKVLQCNLEPESETSQSSSPNDKNKNQKLPISNPGGIEGTKMSEDGKESSAGGFQDSEEPELGKLARMYEEEGFGALTETVRETLVQMYDEFGATWVAEAMREAVLQNKRRLKYVVGILENWRREGGMRRSDGSKGAATDAKAPRRSRADPGPMGRYIPDGPPEDPELDEFLRKVGFYDIPGINC